MLEGARWTVGMEPAVPRNNTERSIEHIFADAPAGGLDGLTALHYALDGSQ
jgi:hypothetical protein